LRLVGLVEIVFILIKIRDYFYLVLLVGWVILDWLVGFERRLKRLLHLVEFFSWLFS